MVPQYFTKKPIENVFIDLTKSCHLSNEHNYILMSDEQQEIPKYQFLRSVMDFDLLALVLLMLRSVAGFVS